MGMELVEAAADSAAVAAESAADSESAVHQEWVTLQDIVNTLLQRHIHGTSYLRGFVFQLLRKSIFLIGE